jgi:hypothetical protein
MTQEMGSLQKKKNQQEILEELSLSLQNTNVLGIFLKGEEEMITTAVVSIQDHADDKLIRFRDADLHGYKVPKNPVKLSDIRSVIHFNTKYDDPVYAQIRARKNGTRKVAVG